MLIEIKASEQRIIELIRVFERSGLICPWWQEDELEEKSAKLLGWLQDDSCQKPNEEKSKPSS